MLFQLLGYRVKNTQLVADHGIDLLVSGPEARYGVVQCKRYRGTVGEPTVRDLYGTLMHENSDHGWLVTTGGISRQAREWATGKPIDLWDGLAPGRFLEADETRIGFETGKGRLGDWVKGSGDSRLAEFTTHRASSHLPLSHSPILPIPQPTEVMPCDVGTPSAP